MKRFAIPLIFVTLLTARFFIGHPVKAAAAASGEPVPASFFSFTAIDSTTPPILPYSTARSWDTWPHPSWSDLSPSRASYNFAPLDQFMLGNKDHDMIYTLGRTPRWASLRPDAHTDYGPGQCAPPTNLADWDDYVRMVASRSAGRIKYWELWNEPQSLKYYCGDMTTMVTLAQHARRIIKSIDPSAQILSPSPTSVNGPKWLASFLSQGGAATVDIVAFHGYGSNTVAEETKPVIEKYKAVAAQYGLAQLPMWDTETSNNPTDAAFLAKIFLLERSLGVSRVLWYAYDHGGPLWNAKTGLSSTGISYQEIYKWMVGASLVSPCSLDSTGLWTCRFSRPGYQAEVVWSSTAAVPMAVPANFKDYRDLEGNVHTISQGTVSVANEPILIETSPLH